MFISSWLIAFAVINFFELKNLNCPIKAPRREYWNRLQITLVDIKIILLTIITRTVLKRRAIIKFIIYNNFLKCDDGSSCSVLILFSFFSMERVEASIDFGSCEMTKTKKVFEWAEKNHFKSWCGKSSKSINKTLKILGFSTGFFTGTRINFFLNCTCLYITISSLLYFFYRLKSKFSSRIIIVIEHTAPTLSFDILMLITFANCQSLQETPECSVISDRLISSLFLVFCFLLTRFCKLRLG